MKRLILLLCAAAILIIPTIALTGCTGSADKVSENLSKDAEQFRIVRRIVGLNGITDKVIFEAVGRCSVEGDGLGNLAALLVICKDPEGYKKHFIGQSDNTTFVVTQIEARNVSEFRTKFILKPENIIPDFDLVTSANTEQP